MYLRNVGTALAVSVAVVGLAAGPAAAAADVYKDEGCDTFDGNEFCYDVHSVFNVTETKSGNYNVISNGKFAYVYTDAAGVLIFSDDGKYHSKFSMKDGETQVSSYRASGSSEYGGTTCTYEVRWHLANGKVQQDSYEFVCVP